MATKPGNERKLVKIGNYALTGTTLGKGHFARVEEAIHIQLNVKVAVKIITFQDIKDNYTLKNLKREAKVLSRLSHPNVIFLFETIASTRKYYIITELVSGGDLCSFIQSQPLAKLTEKQARPLARQIVSAVSHLHERGIVHRDLKMENILLDEAGQKIKLVDFNLSNIRKYNELLNTHCGSPEYAAPELYQCGRKYGPEVDIWSLGVIFYGMIVGRLPFLSWHQHSLTKDARRKNLIAETRKGLTQRHQRLLSEMSCSSLFLNLIAKMLCPNSESRISMRYLQSHSWIYGHFFQEYPALSDLWKRKALERISKFVDLPMTDVYRTIKSAPYGKLNGIYNILRLAELTTRIEADNLRIDLTKLIESGKPPTTDAIAHRSFIRMNESATCRPKGLIRSEGTNVAGSKNQTIIRPLTADTRKLHRIELKASGVFCEAEHKKTASMKKKKCTFSVSRQPTPRTHHHHQSTVNIGNIKESITKKRLPSTLGTNYVGMASHTAARATIRAELEKRVSGKFQRSRKP